MPAMPHAERRHIGDVTLRGMCRHDTKVQLIFRKQTFLQPNVDVFRRFSYTITTLLLSRHCKWAGGHATDKKRRTKKYGLTLP